jgi:anti-sigma factor RsiW
MKDLKTSCRKMDAELADLLLEPESASAEVRDHVAKCEACRRELESLRATMGLLDAWQAPEPSPFFFTRLNARMREEREAQPAGWLSRMRARFTYGGPRLHARPIAAMALTVMLLLGGGAYLSLSKLMQPPQQASDAVVHDLQTLDNNAQVLDTLENLSTPSNNGD